MSVMYLSVPYLYICLRPQWKQVLALFVSSFYLMFFVFIFYAYLYNVLHFILNKSNPIITKNQASQKHK